MQGRVEAEKVTTSVRPTRNLHASKSRRPTAEPHRTFLFVVFWMVSLETCTSHAKARNKSSLAGIARFDGALTSILSMYAASWTEATSKPRAFLATGA